jgi:hypothetical protein
MVSQNQLKANRANAKRSTGPKSELGKNRSKMNALKHGLSSRDIVVWDEDPDEFERFRAEVVRDLSPVGFIQREIADQIAGQQWRLRRINRLEAAALDSDPFGTLNYILQTADPKTRKAVMTRLAKLQRARRQEGSVSKERSEIAFRADFAQALYAEMPEVVSNVIESQKDQDKRGELAQIARHETSLRNALHRNLNLFYSLRGAGSQS